MTPPSRVATTRVAAIINGDAGAFSKMSTAEVETAVRTSLARHGIEAEIEITHGDMLPQAVERARARAESGTASAVLIGGGDGSVRIAASVLVGSEVPLGVLPLGTLNHFAKDLEIPVQIEAAIEIVAARQIRRVDLAEVNGEIFVNNSSIGIYPYMVIDRERRRTQHKLAKWVAVVPAFLRMMRHFPRRRLRIAAEGFERPYRTPCLCVGNNKDSMELFTARRRRRLDGGKLWLYVVKPREPFAFFWMVCRLCVGRMDQARDLDRFEVTDAEVTAKTSRLPVALDGDVHIMHTPLHYRSRPGALAVLTPAGAQANGRSPRAAELRPGQRLPND